MCGYSHIHSIHKEKKKQKKKELLLLLFLNFLSLLRHTTLYTPPSPARGPSSSRTKRAREGISRILSKKGNGFI